jgi:hypothetical protein
MSNTFGRISTIPVSYLAGLTYEKIKNSIETVSATFNISIIYPFVNHFVDIDVYKKHNKVLNIYDSYKLESTVNKSYRLSFDTRTYKITLEV